MAIALAPPIAPYIPVRYTALHRNKDSSISHIQRSFDRSWSVLLLIWQGKHFLAEQEIGCAHTASAVQA